MENAGYRIIRSNRKSFSLRITADARLEIRAPLWATGAEIADLVKKKEPWITARTKEVQKIIASQESYSLSYGGRILFLGTEYVIAESPGNAAGFDGAEFYMPPGLTPEQLKEAMIQLYKKLAANHIRERTAFFAHTMRLEPSSIKINSAKSRWGSCSNQKSLNFSWRLILANEQTVDYVIVHELAHTVHMNHSSNFWALVESVLPDYKKQKEELKALQRLMMKQNW